MSAGGKRKGAGRKPRSEPLVALTLRLAPEVWGAWLAHKDRLSLSGPALLAHLLGLRKKKSAPRRPNVVITDPHRERVSQAQKGNEP
jgi:hypothetical protein